MDLWVSEVISELTLVGCKIWLLAVVGVDVIRWTDCCCHTCIHCDVVMTVLMLTAVARQRRGWSSNDGSHWHGAGCSCNVSSGLWTRDSWSTLAQDHCTSCLHWSVASPGLYDIHWDQSLRLSLRWNFNVFSDRIFGAIKLRGNGLTQIDQEKRQIKQRFCMID